MGKEKAPQIPKSETQSTFNPELEGEKGPQIPKSDTQSTFNPDLENEDQSFISKTYKSILDFLNNNEND